MNTPETSSGNDEWYTPSDVVRALLRPIPWEGRRVIFDPASCEEANKHVGATHFLTKEEDALAPTMEWAPADTLWMNPPFSKPLFRPFVERFLAEWEACPHKWQFAVVLTNAVTDTIAWQQLAEAADVVFFPKGRIGFVNGDGTRVKGNNRGQTAFYFTRGMTWVLERPGMPGVWAVGEKVR